MPRLRLILPAALLLALTPALLAQDVELGKIISDAAKEAEKSAPPAQENPSPVTPDAQGSRPTPNRGGGVPGPDAAQRALAEAVLADCNEIATATNLWAQEKKKGPKTRVTLKDILPYLKPDSPVVTSGGNDRAGHPFDFGIAEAGPYVSSATVRELGQPQSFWGDYAPLPSKREIAIDTLADLKQIRLAVLKRDAEGVGNPGDKITFDALRGYLPEDSDVWKAEGFDRLGNEYFLGTAKDPVHI